MSLPTLAVAVAVLTLAGVFAFPFLFPPSHRIFAASYTAGFNNRIAALTASSISFLVLIALLWFRRQVGHEPYATDRVRWRWFVVVAIACTVFTAIGGALLCAAGVSYNDNRYFIDPMDLAVSYHRHIYTDFEFLYGPLLLYFPVAIHLLLRPLHTDVAASYYVALAIGQIIGLLMLFYVVNALPATRSMKTIIFLLFGLQTLSPLLGLNYSFIRGAVPFAALVLLARISNPWLAAAVACASQMVALGVSPEMGVAFAAGAIAFSVVKAYGAGYEWLGIAVAPVLGTAAFLPLAGHGYVDSLALFSRGGLNLIVEPLPYMLVFVFALIWLAPAAVAIRLRDNAPLAPMLGGFYLAGLALVAPAFGRCDPLHVMFNGLGIYLLSMVTASALSRRWRFAWICCVAFALMFTEAVNIRMYRFDFAPGWHWAFYHSPESLQQAVARMHGYPGNESAPDAREWFRPDISRFEAWTGKSPIATPVIIPYGLEKDLKQTGHYAPDYYEFLISVSDPESEEAKVQTMRRNEWALVPDSDYSQIETPQNSARILGFGFSYPWRRTPYARGRLLEAELANNWRCVAAIGQYELYEQKHTTEPSPR